MVVEKLLQAEEFAILSRDLPSSGLQGAVDQIHSDKILRLLYTLGETHVREFIAGFLAGVNLSTWLLK